MSLNDEPDLTAIGGDSSDLDLLRKIRRLFSLLFRDKAEKFRRYLPMADYFMNRWERAESMGFGRGTSVYDSCLVLGDVSVAEDTWIGPFTILDGSGGGLSIGAHCAISAGVHIYTHDTVECIVTRAPVTKAPVKIGDNVYIGPQTVVAKGVTIGSGAIVGANSFVNRDIPAGAKAFGNPARIHVEPKGGKL